MSLSSACVTSSVLAESRTAAGSEPGSGLTAATVCASWPDSCLSGPVTKWRRSSPPRSMSTMTQAPSASDSSRAHRCRVTDSLKVTFSSSSRLAVVARSSRRVITVTMGSGGASCGRGRPRAGAGRGRVPGRDEQPVVVAAHADRPHVQRAADPALGRQQLAVQLPALLAAGRRGEQRADRRAAGRLDQRAERLPGRVAAGRPEQRAGGRIGAAHGAVLAEHEQRDRHLLEHRVQQAALGVHGARGPLLLAGPGGLGLRRAQRVDRAVQLGQGRVEQRPQVRAGHRGGLLQGLMAGPQLRHAVGRRLAVRDVWHGAIPISSGPDLRGGAITLTPGPGRLVRPACPRRLAVRGLAARGLAGPGTGRTGAPALAGRPGRR